MRYNPKIVAAYFRDCGLPEPLFEYRFAPPRRWRIDVAFPNNKGEGGGVAIEVQGGTFVQGRHNRGAAMLKEWEKLNTLAAMDWRVLYVQPSELCMHETVGLIRECLMKGE